LSPGDHTVDLSLSDVPQSNHAKIMLTVSKDLSFAQAISSEFSLPNHPPEAYIDPVFNEDKVEGLHSIIYDLEDQFHLKTAWSEAAKTLETGRDLTLQQLKGLGEGKHDIVLTVTDSDGKISTDHLLLRITHDGNVELVKPSHLLAWVLKFVLPGTLLLAAAAIILYRLKKRGAPM
jgi:hypothetical protein